MRLVRFTPQTPSTPSTPSSDAAAAAPVPTSDRLDKGDLFKLAVTTLLAASGATFCSQAPAPDLARLIAAPTSTSLLLDSTAQQAIGATSAMGRAVEVALRTGILEIPRSALSSTASPTATPADTTAAPDDEIAATTATIDTTATTTTTGEARTSVILAADKIWMITPTSMASSSPLAQAFLADLPTSQQTLATDLLARAVAGEPEVATTLMHAFREAVRTNASTTDRQSLIRTALTTSTPIAVVLAHPGLVDNATPRQRDVMTALGQLGDDQIYAYNLIDSIVDAVIDPGWLTKTAPEQQTTFDALFSDRSRYLGVTQIDPESAPVVVAEGAAVLTAAACSANPARQFRIDDLRAHPQGCAQTITFTTPAGTDTITLITPPTVSPQHPAVDQTARALSRVDDGVRTLIKTVVLNPVENPDDAIWRATPGFSSTHTSFMTARTTDNTVHIYPSSATWTGEALERVLAGSFTHEAAHLLQPLVKADRTLQALWTTATTSKIDLHASSYAFSNDAEDFAESFTIYMTTKGAPSHEAYRVLMPTRFAAFEAIEAKLLAPPPAATPPTTSTPRS